METSQMQNIIDRRFTALQYWATRLLPAVEWTPHRIAITYAFFGACLLLFSDVLLVQYVSEPLLSQVQALKGGGEVVLTAGIIYSLTSRRESQLHQQSNQLRQQRQELEVLHRVLRHNLSNDLNVIAGYVNLVRDQMPSEPVRSHCEKVIKTTDKIIRYTEKADRIKQVSTQNETVQTQNLTEVVPELVEDYSERSDDIDVSVSVPDHAMVEVNTMFRAALDELVTNAIKHNDAETPQVRIDVFTEIEQSHRVEIQITDNGPGIPDPELQPLQAGTEDQIQHMSGMGLWFVKWTVRQCNGELTFQTDEERGTSVSVRIPKAPEMLSPSLAPMNSD